VFPVYMHGCDWCVYCVTICEVGRVVSSKTLNACALDDLVLTRYRALAKEESSVARDDVGLRLRFVVAARACASAFERAVRLREVLSFLLGI
jgi:ferredoxin